MTVIGFTAFYAFATSGNQISRREGTVLALLYCAFALLHVGNLTNPGAGPQGNSTLGHLNAPAANVDRALLDAHAVAIWMVPTG